jgi:integrase
MPRWIADMGQDILAFWGKKPLSDVTIENCNAYVQWRTSQPIRRFRHAKPRLVSSETARHELSILKAAINHYHAMRPLTALPKVSLPNPAPPKEDYCWSREEAGRRLWAARRLGYEHLIRLILIGLYSGGRSGSIFALRWLPSPRAGWIDLDAKIPVVHRRGEEETPSKKRRPPIRVHAKLIRHLRHWRKIDLERGLSHVVHYRGLPVKTVRCSWERARIASGAERIDRPHVLRHTCASRFMAAGIDVAVIGSALGMTVKTLWDRYGHLHPKWQADIATATAPRTPQKQRNRTGTR